MHYYSIVEFIIRIHTMPGLVSLYNNSSMECKHSAASSIQHLRSTWRSSAVGCEARG